MKTIKIKLKEGQTLEEYMAENFGPMSDFKDMPEDDENTKSFIIEEAPQGEE